MARLRCAWILLVAACERSPAPPTPTVSASARDASLVDAGAAADALSSADASPPVDDPMALHREGTGELLALVGLDGPFARASFGAGPARMNQGNKSLAHHAIGKRACLEGLNGITIQTSEQRARCGAENMVPIFRGGHAEKAAACIDVFEFPNVACELPIVWSSPSQAAHVCELAGKRLCTQEEWTMGCAADPAGGKDSAYAYGEELDLDACNTTRAHAYGPDGRNWVCNVKSAQTAWDTCATDTEPAGSFPRCRSRFGVFDQHGNVAEIMTRKTPDGVVSQLKGSAFFYVDVARRRDQPPPKDGARETYPDHCAYDARWHIEPIETATHVNYHLGFRCCKSL